ncbi:MAG: alkaline phosphatase family protein [Hyphomicrobiales bacterium]|nr:alkaline phosphatase family protein [Hyphomicrobiales bacterium]MBV8823412.1 alkaline phosphatase family protein [Hyphomicrobiales bacterium]MBV9428767.1 alkaline phosphatase family protein [Bradyrhizobiaceae bacterium]
MMKFNAARAMLFAALIAGPINAAAQQPHNLVLFVPDGLRALLVTPESAPTMAAVRDEGVNFRNPHSLFPTFTMANASGLSTGHSLGDTGVFSNTLFSGYPIPPTNTVTPFIENDTTLGNIDAHFGGSFISEESVLAAARQQGLSTAAIGKLGPTLLFDHTDRTGEPSIIFDDWTGSEHGIPLSQEISDALTAAGLPLKAPSRGENGKPGNATTPGTLVANLAQQAYFAEVAAKIVLPLFKARNKPFVLVFWSRDPDGTQHYQGDSLNQHTPGINGPTSRAALKNADDNLKTIRQALDDLGLAASTDIVIAADHGFSTISKESATSPAAKMHYADVTPGFLPPGFLAIDIARALDLPLYDANNNNAPVGEGTHPKAGNGLIGRNAAAPDVVVAANGGSDLVYVLNRDRALVARIVEALFAQDYVSGLFVDDDLGPIAGTLALSDINLRGSAKMPVPSIVVNFRSFSTGCEQPVLCTVEVADTALQQGQGMHGSFSRADTMNFMAAIGPSFKRGYADNNPVSNADIGQTLARVVGLKIPFRGSLMGRVIEEALPGGAEPAVTTQTLRAQPAANALATALSYSQVGTPRYFSAAGFPGRTVGLTEQRAEGR